MEHKVFYEVFYYDDFNDLHRVVIDNDWVQYYKNRFFVVKCDKIWFFKNFMI